MGSSQSLFKKKKKKNINLKTISFQPQPLPPPPQEEIKTAHSTRSLSQITTQHTDTTQRTSFSTHTTLIEPNKYTSILDPTITTTTTTTSTAKPAAEKTMDIKDKDKSNDATSIKFNSNLSERDIMYAKHAAATAIGFDPLDYENNQWYSNDPNNTTTKTMVKKDTLNRQLYRDLFTFQDNRSKEIDRQQRQHYLLKKILGGNYKIPLPTNPSLIINWSCGTANWVMELSQELNCKIVGIDDEEAMLPSLIHSSGKFEFLHANLYSGITGLEKYNDNQADYIMMRDVWLINQPIDRWRILLKQVFRVLKPGGYVEIIERDQIVRSAGPELTTLINWTKNLFKSITDGIDINSVLIDYLKMIGYENITEACYRVPIGEWSDNSYEREMGYLNQDVLDRQYHLFAHHIAESNNVREKEVQEKITNALSECEEYKPWMVWRYYSAQKQPLN